MREILGETLDFAFKTLEINANKTFDSGEYQVWELSDEEFEKLDSITEDNWESDWGWWRWSEGSTMGSTNKRFSINGHHINAWKGGNVYSKYSNLIEYFGVELNLSSERNIVTLAVDLAQQNGLKLSELFNKYQINKYERNRIR